MALVGAGILSLYPLPLRLAELALASPPTTLAVPVADVARSSLRDSFGASRSGGRSHQGIDIFAPRGTPVMAAADGVVWSTQPNALGGNVVWILGPGRQMHYYAHLDHLHANATPLRVVCAGDIVGFVGDTGNARGTSPHLHYGIYGRSGALNPHPLLIVGRGNATPEHVLPACAGSGGR